MVEVTKWLAYEVVEIGPAFAWAIFARSSNPTHESQPWRVALLGTRTSKSEARAWARMEAESVAGRIEALFARIYFESTKTALVDMTTPGMPIDLWHSNRPFTQKALCFVRVGTIEVFWGKDLDGLEFHRQAAEKLGLTPPDQGDE
jgi:hypothetical protein